MFSFFLLEHKSSCKGIIYRVYWLISSFFFQLHRQIVIFVHQSTWNVIRSDEMQIFIMGD